MRGFVAKIAFSVALLFGVECGAFATELKGVEFKAAELSRTEVNVLPESDLWVVGDIKLSVRDMVELQLMLSDAARQGRAISLCFPNLLALPAMDCEAIGFGAGTVEVAYGGAAVVKVEMPKVVHVGDNAFLGSYRLHTLVMPKATHIGYNAFAGCVGLIAVEAPAIEYLKEGAFYSNKPLAFPLPTQAKSRAQILSENERVAAAERAIESERGVALEGEKQIAVRIEKGAVVSMEKRLQEPFEDAAEIVELVCGAVEVVGREAFAGCEKLRYLSLATDSGAKIRKIDAAAFEGVDTSKIELVVGAASKRFVEVESNTLSVGRFTAKFKRIKIRW
ncbi:MAG: leucine-rich repeat protein [Rikenellaceae bacterium]